jgi:hypothetical protein
MMKKKRKEIERRNNHSGNIYPHTDIHEQDRTIFDRILMTYGAFFGFI